MRFKILAVISLVFSFLLVYRLSNNIQRKIPVLVDSFGNDESLANTIYKDRNIIIEGVVEKISFLNERSTIFVKTEGFTSSILCEMGEDHKGQVKQLKKNQQVVVEGTCKGFLGNVILLNCLLLKMNIDE